jgi:hypothetical protein
MMPLSTDQLLEWLDQRYPRPIYRTRLGEDSEGLTNQFLIDTGKRQLVEELITFWEDQTRS